MDCCGGHSENHQNYTDNPKEKKFPWTSIIVILLIVGLIVFSILK